MFIHNKREAQIAAEIAARHGYTALTAKTFLNRYHTSVFSPWTSDRDAQYAMNEIAQEIRKSRAWKR